MGSTKSNPYSAVGFSAFFFWSMVVCFGTSLPVICIGVIGYFEPGSAVANILSVGGEFRAAAAALARGTPDIGLQQFVQAAFLKLAIVPPFLLLAFFVMLLVKFRQIAAPKPGLSFLWFLSACGVFCLFVWIFYFLPLTGFPDGDIYYKRGISHYSPLATSRPTIFFYDLFTTLGLVGLSLTLFTMVGWVKEAISSVRAYRL